MANALKSNDFIYSYNSYKEFLKDSLTRLGHGSRLKLAKALNCQSAYISLVMNKDAHLSLEQAEEVVEFLELSQHEAEYFVLLVQSARAGTTKLRQRWARQLKALREEQTQLSKRVTGTDILDEAVQARYYSRWYYAAIHMAVTVPGLQTRKAMRTYLGLANEQLEEALEFLEEVGLVRKQGSEYVTGNSRVYLKSDSPFINRHHANLRECTVQFLGCDDKASLHYSTFFSLSKQDYLRIKERLLIMIEDVRGGVRPTNKEELAVFAVDWFVPRKSGDSGI